MGPDLVDLDLGQDPEDLGVGLGDQVGPVGQEVALVDLADLGGHRLCLRSLL